MPQIRKENFQRNTTFLLFKQNAKALTQELPPHGHEFYKLGRTMHAYHYYTTCFACSLPSNRKDFQRNTAALRFYHKI